MTNSLEQNSDRKEIERQKRERFLADRQHFMDRVLDEAQAKGLFDNLPGRGKPLQLDHNPYAEEQQLAHKILRDNNFTLPWIADRAEMVNKIEAWRAELNKAWQTGRDNYAQATTASQKTTLNQKWGHCLSQLEADLATLNKAIGNLNLRLPIASMEILKLNLDEELARITAGRALIN